MALEMGKRLMELRKREGLSQEQLGRTIGVSRQTVSKWELGESVPDTENVVELSKLYQVTTDFLLFGEIEKIRTEIQGRSEKESSEMEAIRVGTSDLEKEANRKRTSKVLLISGIVTGSIGALGILVIWVLSTMFRSYEDTAITNLDTGETIWQYSDGYSFSGFVEMHRLQALLGIFVFCLLAAALMFTIRQLGKHLD